MAKGRRFVSFAVLSYPENSDYKVHIARCKHDGFPYAYIIHDKDAREDGTPDKTHCHSLIRVPNGQTLSAFASKFRLEERFVQGISSYKDYALYLVHGDYDSKLAGKYQYDASLVQGTLAGEVRGIIKRHKEIKQASSKEDD